MTLNSIIRWPQRSRQPSLWNWPTSDWVRETCSFGWESRVSRVWEMQTDSRHFQVICGFYPHMKSAAGWRPKSCFTPAVSHWWWSHVLHSFQSSFTLVRKVHLFIHAFAYMKPSFLDTRHIQLYHITDTVVIATVTVLPLYWVLL